MLHVDRNFFESKANYVSLGVLPLEQCWNVWETSEGLKTKGSWNCLSVVLIFQWEWCQGAFWNHHVGSCESSTELLMFHRIWQPLRLLNNFSTADKARCLSDLPAITYLLLILSDIVLFCNHQGFPFFFLIFLTKMFELVKTHANIFPSSEIINFPRQTTSVSPPSLIVKS